MKWDHIYRIIYCTSFPDRCALIPSLQLMHIPNRESYLDVPELQIFLLDWNLFKERWERAGRRSSGMGDWGECLCMTIEALSARTTDCRQILGPEAPKLCDRKEWKGIDLTPWGKRRDGFCESMLRRAIKAADDRGVGRVANLDNILNLLLLAYLSEREFVALLRFVRICVERSRLSLY